MAQLEGYKILMFVHHLYEDLELWYPKLRLEEEGAQVIVAGFESGAVYQGKNGYPCPADAAITEIDASQFQALVLPGGFAPDKLRRIPQVLHITRSFMKDNKVIGHICHAGWIAISADIMSGFRCTSTPGIKDDLVNAGATWVDEPVVVDRNMISSRNPKDLPVFARAIIDHLIP